jgi:coenzyme F420-dependent glucose-6-phosphate dehydrogenase
MFLAGLCRRWADAARGRPKAKACLVRGIELTKIGYHASHEQFPPSQLLRLVQRAEGVGFDAAKCSDHFHPWSERQGQSGYAWSWLGAVMQATALPLGVITAPGYRYHPAILAQGAATLGEMFPGRFWLALGSGEAVNESITGLYWPEKAERNARLRECAQIIRDLLAGETVTHRGRVTTVEAKLYTRSAAAIPLLAAAVSEETARFIGSWADGMLTVGGEPGAFAKVVDAFRQGGGENKPIIVQAALCWAPTEQQAIDEALHQWRHGVVAGDAVWDLRRAVDFDKATEWVGLSQLKECLPISSSLQQHIDRLGALLELGTTELYLHQVGRNQAEFIDTFGSMVLPALRG